MGDRGKFSGFNWHNEFHSEKRKDKVSDCVFLSEERICGNKKSPYYLSKCFIATTCPLRMRSEEQEKADKRDEVLRAVAEKQRKIIAIPCTLPPQCKIYSKAYGEGVFLSYTSANRIITLDFNGKQIKFKYPEAFQMKHLEIIDCGKSCYYADLKKAQWE